MSTPTRKAGELKVLEAKQNKTTPSLTHYKYTTFPFDLLPFESGRPFNNDLSTFFILLLFIHNIKIVV